MIYMLLNIVLCVVLIWASFSIDTRNGVQNNNHVINLVLFLATILGVTAVCMIAGFWAPRQLAQVLARVQMVLVAWYSVQTCIYLMGLPSHKKNTAVTIIQWVFDLIAVYVVFIARNASKDALFSTDGFVITSSPAFSGKLGEFLPITWFQFYQLFYFVVLPLVSLLMVLVKAEVLNSKLDRQRLQMDGLAVLAFWVTYVLLMLATKVQPMISTMMSIAFIVEILVFIRAASLDATWDFKAVVRTVVPFILKFVIPGALVGLVYMLILPEYFVHPGLFFIIFVFTIDAVITLWYQMAKVLSKKNFFRGNDYAKRFEDEIASIDYSSDPKEITVKLSEIFKQYVDTSAIHILIDGGVGDLETVYSSSGDKFTIPLSNVCFDNLLNINHPIVFRDYAENNYNVAAFRKELLKLLEETKSEAFVMINEGRHIVGALFLGKKVSGNVYNDYDYSVFSKLYSYLFVVGYYMKNIANESVVGTVNREIKMSGQIITSIQENMDRIKSEKIDAGYLMVPAHNIGGEFIDLIRLTDTRHIFVIGAMSGKGIAASMSMVILKSVIRTFLAETKDFKLLVEKINTFIRTGLPKGTFFAGMFGLLDFATDTMYYINCGSPALFLYTRAYNNVIEIQGEGRVLGFAKDIDHLIKVKKVKLSEGDIVLACTDGLIETHSLRGEIFGKDRTQKALMENATYPSEKMARFTYDSLVQFTSKELEDDVSILVLKYLGGK